MCRNGKWKSSTERMVCGHHVYGDVWEVALHGYILKSGSLLVHPWCYKEGYSVYPMIEFSAVADEIVGDGKFLESTHCMGASHLRLSCHNKWRELYVPTMGPKCTRCPPWTHTHTHIYIYIHMPNLHETNFQSWRLNHLQKGECWLCSLKDYYRIPSNATV